MSILQTLNPIRVESMVTFFIIVVVMLQAYDQNEIPFNYLRQNSLNHRINESKRLNGQNSK